MKPALPNAGDASEHVSEPGQRIDVVELARLDQRAGDRPTMSAAIAAREEMILSSKSYCPFILPMSGRNWKFITAGIPGLAARSASGRCRSGRMVDMSGYKFRLVRSY